MDWQTARVFAGVAASLAFYFFCYLLSFICSSQVRGVRYFNVFFALTLCCLQGLTFYVFKSDICDEYGCTFSRGAGFSVAALASFLIAAVSFLFTHDYPGDRFDKTKAGQIKTYSRPLDLPPHVQNDEIIEEEPSYEEEEIVEDEVGDKGEEMIEEEVIEDDDVAYGDYNAGDKRGGDAAAAAAYGV